MELYWGSGSAPCWKALIALHEKGFADSETGKEKFKSNFISFSNKEQKSKPVMDVNVRGEVPAFKDGNIIVNESNAIVLYLEANNESIREQLQELREDGFTVEKRFDLTADNMELYWGSGSPPSWKAMIALHEKDFGGKYKSNLISFSEKEHKKAPLITINKRGQVPTFKDGDINVNEGSAIVLYLELNYKNKGTKLIPDDPKAMAEVLQRHAEIEFNFNAKFMMPLVFKIAFQNKGKEDEVKKTEEVKKAYEAAKEELNLYEEYLKNSAGKFIAGKEFTMADIPFIVCLSFLNRFGCEFKKFPKLKEYFERVSKRPSVQDTQPPHWKESPAPTAVMDTLDQ